MADNTQNGVEVDLNPVLQHVGGKVLDDKKALKEMLDDPTGARNFKEQHRLLSEFQAGVLTIDILNSAAKPKIAPAQNGQPPKASTQTQVNPFEGTPTPPSIAPAMANSLVDMDELEKQLSASLPQSAGG